MNIFWNVVNLALAVPGLRHSMITDPGSLSLAETVAEYGAMKRIVLMNAALDVAYITGGFLMKEMAKREIFLYLSYDDSHGSYGSSFSRTGDNN